MERSSNVRVMVDTTVLVAGSVWPRWPHEVLLAAYRGEFQLVLCPYVIDQARRVLKGRFPHTILTVLRIIWLRSPLN